jgi:hypothetical protein
MLEVNGFDFIFDESKCLECGGKCCIGDSGFIWINVDEMFILANFLQISVDELKNRFLEKIGYKFSIKEKIYKDGYACIFFDEKQQNCGIYDARPHQCRSFPFWEYFKNNLKELEKECVGVKFL